MADRDEVKPTDCPFCGYFVHAQSRVNKGAASGRMFFCRCPMCHAEGPRSNASEADAIRKWNTRTPPAEQVADSGEVLQVLTADERTALAKVKWSAENMTSIGQLTHGDIKALATLGDRLTATLAAQPAAEPKENNFHVILDRVKGAINKAADNTRYVYDDQESVDAINQMRLTATQFVQTALSSSLAQPAAGQVAMTDGSEITDADRYRHLVKERDVMLLTTFFGNGCINRTIAEVETIIDEKIRARRAATGSGK